MDDPREPQERAGASSDGAYSSSAGPWFVALVVLDPDPVEVVEAADIIGTEALIASHLTVGGRAVTFHREAEAPRRTPWRFVAATVALQPALLALTGFLLARAPANPAGLRLLGPGPHLSLATPVVSPDAAVAVAIVDLVILGLAFAVLGARRPFTCAALVGFAAGTALLWAHSAAVPTFLLDASGVGSAPLARSLALLTWSVLVAAAASAVIARLFLRRALRPAPD